MRKFGLVFLAAAAAVSSAIGCSAGGNGGESTGSVASASTAVSVCAAPWARYSSKPYEQVALPETNVGYWRYAFQMPVPGSLGDTTGPRMFKVTGAFADARYINFNVYDQETMDTYGSLPDRDIEPDTGSVNPFRPGVARDAKPRNYTVWLVPNGMKDAAKAALAAKGIASPNVMEMPAPEAPWRDEFGHLEPDNRIQKLEFWYRVYLANDPNDAQGGAPLPTIEAYDLRSATPSTTACPPVSQAPQALGTAFASLPPRSANGNVDFYAGGGSLYPNGDNRYLTAQPDFGPGRDVAVVRFKPPSFPNTRADAQAPLEGHDVRYWSLCVGGFSTKTSGCLSDGEVHVDADGKATFVVGPEDLEGRVRAKGLNFLARGSLLMPLLVYRNLLTDPAFEGRVSKMPLWPPTAESPADPTTYAASNPAYGLGDHAPQGHVYSVAEFKQAFGIEGPVDTMPAAAPRHASTRDPHDTTTRIGVSASFFFPRMLNGLTQVAPASQTPRSVTRTLNVAEDILTIDFHYDFAIDDTKFLVGPIDNLAQDLAEGAADLAIIDGPDYPWIHRLYPDIVPLVRSVDYDGGHQPAATAGTSLKTVFLVAASAPTPAGLGDLRGKRLGITDSAHSAELVALDHLLRDAGEDPSRFFAEPNLIPANIEDAIDDLVGDDTERPNYADVLLLSQKQWEAYASNKPGRARMLKVVDAVTFPTIPLPLVVYSTRMNTQWVDWYRQQLTHANDTTLGWGALSQITGTWSFVPMAANYTQALDAFGAKIADQREYRLPIYFFGIAPRKMPQAPVVPVPPSFGGLPDFGSLGGGDLGLGF